METMQDYQSRSSLIIKKALEKDSSMTQKISSFFTDLSTTSSNKQNVVNKPQKIQTNQKDTTSYYDVNQVNKMGSLSNQVYKVDLKNGNTILVKHYLDVLKQFVTRNIQHQILEQMTKKKQYPYVFYYDNYCRIQAFIPGSSIRRQKLNQKLLRNITKSLAKFSRVYQHIASQKKQSKNRQIQNLFQMFRDLYKTKRVQNPQLVGKVKQYVEGILQKKQILQNLKKLLQNHRMIMNHNDSNLSNILVLNSIDNENPNIQLLDFEFSNMNYIGYDIGNLLNQIATDYGGAYGIDQTGKQHKFEIRSDWEVDKQIVKQMIDIYFNSVEQNTNNKTKAQQRFRYVGIGRLLSHLYWLFVGLKQIDDPNIDLNMIYYIKRRYQEFFKLYNQFIK